MKYIDNDINHGLLYDFDKIKKEVKKLGIIPQGQYNPFVTHTVESARNYVDLSERSVGKTTNWLLLGMTMRRLHPEFQIGYIRQTLDMIMPKNTQQLFATIKAHGYVDKLTDGRFNTVTYKSRAWYYYNDETEELDSEPFMLMLAIELWAEYKSSLNAPFCDLLIVDEFIGKITPQDEFVHLNDVIKTVIRERDSPFIVYLANTINKQHIYFKELEIYESVNKMKIGERKTVTTAMGTIVSIALIGYTEDTMPIHRKEHNRKFFGYKNPKLNAIRGGEWAGKIYPHLPRLQDPIQICCNRYIRHNGYLINLEMFFQKDIGFYVSVHGANRTYDDSIVYHIDTTILSANERYKWGSSKVDDMYKKLLNENKWYYATNTEGSLIDDYIKAIRTYDRFIQENLPIEHIKVNM